MNKNHPIFAILAILILIGGIVYLSKSQQPISKLNKTPEQKTSTADTWTEQQNKTKKSYNIIEEPLESNQIIGGILSIDSSQITIYKIKNLKCFYAFDYIWDESNKLSEEEIDQKYNTDYLPWCQDPSGGTYYIETKEKFAFNFTSSTKFLLWQDRMEQKTSSTKEEFIKKVSNDKVLITFNGGTAISIESVYED